jgi:hypothetical protein
LFQTGYNLYNKKSIYRDWGYLYNSKLSSVAQFAVGVGYLRSIRESGAGPFIQLKFEDQIFNAKVQTSSSTPPVNTSTANINYSLLGAVATIGLRF